MVQMHGKLPRELHRGLCDLLIETARFDGSQDPLAILTTAPAQWLSAPGLSESALVDVSGLTGPTAWRSDQDIISGLLDSARAVGWLDQQLEVEVIVPLPAGFQDSAGRSRKVVERTASNQPIVVTYHQRETTSSNNPWVFTVQKSGSPSSSADLLIKNSDGTPLAVVEVKRAFQDLPKGLDQARRLASASSAQFAIATDGSRFLLASTEGESVKELTGLPSPEQLGVQEAVRRDPAPDPLTMISTIGVHSVGDFLGLAQSLETLNLRNVVIDYTLPWASHRSSFANHDELITLLPQFDHLVDQLSGVLALMASADQVGRLTAIVPRMMLEGSMYSPLRNFLTARLSLSGVVELPPSVLSPVTSAHASLITLDVSTNKQERLAAFSSLSSRGDVIEPIQQQWFHDFREGLEGRAMTLGFRTHVVQAQAWTATAQNPESRQIEARLARAIGTETLGELCDVYQGVRFPREEGSSTGVPVVRGKNLASENLSTEELSKFKLDMVPEHLTIRSGDILVQRIGASPRILVASEELQGAVAGDTVFILRPRETRVDPIVIVEFLASSIGQQLLVSRARTTTVPTLSLFGLRSVPIPIPDEDISMDLRSVRQIEEDLRTRADAFAARRLALFAVANKNEFRTRLQELRQSSRSAAVGLDQFDSLSFRIQTLYPYPIAYPFRTLAGFTNPSDRYRAQLGVVENILAFLASVSLALLIPPDQKKVGDLFAERLSSSVSMGSWRELAQKAGIALSQSDDEGLAKSLAALWTNKRIEFADRLQKLTEARNNLSHGRGFTLEEEFRQGAEVMQVELERIMEDLGFFVDHPIRLIQDVGIRRQRQNVIFHTLRLVGDHPGFRQESLPRNDLLYENELYIETQPGHLHSLYPYVVNSNCQLCKHREIYFIERWKGPDHPAVLKSFERGHIELNVDVGNELQRLLNTAE